MFLATAVAMTGCLSQDYHIEGEISEADGDVITLRINRPGDRQIMKAPAGGQHGDGFQNGNQWSDYLKNVDYDYNLEDICIFVYKSERSDAMNSSPYTDFLYKVYVKRDQMEIHFDRENDTHAGHPIDAHYITAKIGLDGFRKLGFHHIAVVGNVGDITEKVNNLGELRDYISTEASFIRFGDTSFVYADCTGDASTHNVEASGASYSKFAMGLYEEPTWVDNKSNGSDNNPHIAIVTLERLAARIDLEINNFPSERSQREDAFAPIPYKVNVDDNGTSTTLSKNWLTHVRMINAKQTPSYLIRRTADDPRTIATSAAVEYLGQEKDNNNITTNYVLTPNTANPLTTYFGETSLHIANLQEFKEAERVVSRQAYTPYNGGFNDQISALSFDGSSNNNYFIVGYTEENTVPTDRMIRNYTTGLLFRSIYEPATVYRLNATNDGYVEETLALTEDVLSDGSTPAGGIKSEHYGKTFWMMERLVPNPTEADRVYFIADADGDQEGEGADTKAGTTTEAGKAKIKKAAELYMEAHNETGWTQPLEYVGGVAYNYYWIRHSNSQGTGHPFSPMEYSIVRNNIYSVSISSFTGPGAPSTDPTMDNPDRIQPITYVHKWHPYTVEEVGM